MNKLNEKDQYIRLNAYNPTYCKAITFAYNTVSTK